MMFNIPNPLIPYVRISKKQGLICSPDIPDDLMPLFEKAKHDYEVVEQKRLSELNSLIEDSNK